MFASTSGKSNRDSGDALKIHQSFKAAETFSNLYYDALNKQRHVLSKFYMADASLAWNGNSVTGAEAIAHFYQSLPLTEISISSLSSIPVSEVAVNAQTTILVQVMGSVAFQKKPSHLFFQTFLLTVQEEKWKVITDVFRFQETV